jgi:serine/threonine protein kinase
VKWNKSTVAIKFCKLEGNVDNFMNEVTSMVKVSPHPNVVQVFGVSLDGPQPVIIMECSSGGSLDKLLFNSKENLPDERKNQLLRGTAAGCVIVINSLLSIAISLLEPFY